jgi:Sodium:solute symporter family
LARVDLLQLSQGDSLIERRTETLAIATVTLSSIARKRIHTSSQYLHARRALPLPITAIAFLAANCGALEIVGLVATIAKYGILALHFYWLGAIPAIIFLSLFMMPIYARSGAMTVSDFLQNIRLQVASPDLRPALIFDHLQDVAINGLNVQANASAESALRIIDSKDILLTAPRLLTSTTTFLQLEGADNERITIDGGDISKAQKPLTLADKATKTSIKIRS